MDMAHMCVCACVCVVLWTVKAHVNRERTCAFIQRHNADPDTR